MQLQCISKGIIRLVNSTSPKGGNHRSRPMPDKVFPTPKMNERLARLWDGLLAEPVLPHPEYTQQSIVVPPQKTDRSGLGLLHRDEPVRPSWRNGLARWFQDTMELQEGRVTLPSADEANSEPSPFRWEPKHTGMNVPGRSNGLFSNTINTRRFAPRRTKIPIRPLHKQPFYRRFLFYLRRWLSSSLWQESDPAA